jgi:hypothetical protein
MNLDHLIFTITVGAVMIYKMRVISSPLMWWSPQPTTHTTPSWWDLTALFFYSKWYAYLVTLLISISIVSLISGGAYKVGYVCAYMYVIHKK